MNSANPRWPKEDTLSKKDIRNYSVILRDIKSKFESSQVFSGIEFPDREFKGQEIVITKQTYG